MSSERAREHPRIALARGAEWLAPIVPLAAALSVWAPLRDNYFAGDDFPHLYDIVTRNVPTLLGQFWGGHSIGVFNIVTLAFFPSIRPRAAALLLRRPPRASRQHGSPLPRYPVLYRARRARVLRRHAVG